MKIYLITQKDIDSLLDKINKKDQHGKIETPQEQFVKDEIYRFFNYQVRTWIDEISK